MSDYAIETEHLSRSFKTLKAVDDLSFQVATGTVFGFLGANGAGKTTTIHMLLGLLQLTDGDAQVLGFDVRTEASAIRARSGALLEFNGLYERMNAEDNLDFYGRINHMPRNQRQARIKELLTHMDLWDRRRDQVGTWSRGMKQKLALARTLLHRPALVFLDEPTAGLDPFAAATLNQDLVKIVKQEGVTVFLNTHNLADAEKYCDQVGVIAKGKLRAIGNPDELRIKLSGAQIAIVGSAFTQGIIRQLRQQPGITDVDQQGNRLLIRLDQTREVAPFVDLIVQAGGHVEEVQRDHGSLEDVFMNLMEDAKC